MSWSTFATAPKSLGYGVFGSAMRKPNANKIDKKSYEKELARLQLELVNLQEFVKAEGERVVVVVEGRDAAGKGGVIKRMTQRLNPRLCRVAALPVPTEKEKTQWYFQRYVAQLPAAGEIVLFDRSWYNRAGVERVMGFCTQDQLAEFYRTCAPFEEMLTRSGITLVKYWFSIEQPEQERRFQDRLDDPTKRWKLSPMDVESRSLWAEYTAARDDMFEHTDTRSAPWYIVDANCKRSARLNTIHHLLEKIPCRRTLCPDVTFTERIDDPEGTHPPDESLNWVPGVY